MATYNAEQIAPTISGGTHDPRTAEIAFTGTIAPSPPTFGTFSPVAGAVSRTAAVSFTVTDADGLGTVVVWGELADGTLEMVYDGTAFSTAFDAASTVAGTTTKTFSIQHDAPGWTGNYTLHAFAADTQGASDETSSAYTLTNPPAVPSFGSFSPAAGEVSRTDNVDFTVTDAEGFASIFVWAVLADGTTVVVYDGAAFGAQVNAASTVSGTTTKSFSITHDGDGWLDDYTLHVRAIDATGASATTSSAYTLSDPPAPPDVTTPELSNLSPAADSTIARSAAVEFDVTDDAALSLVIVGVLYSATGEYEVAHDGDAFAPRYVAKSTRTNITGGYHFKLIRTGGWPSAPTFRVRARDASNNEV